MEERVAFLRQRVEELVRAGAHDEALERLYELSALLPSDADIHASLEHVKEFLVMRYARALGGLDKIPSAMPVREIRSAEAIPIRHLANGRASYDDIVRASSLGRIRTLQLLCELYGDDNALALARKGRPRVTAQLPVRPTPPQAPLRVAPPMPAPAAAHRATLPGVADDGTILTLPPENERLLHLLDALTQNEEIRAAALISTDGVLLGASFREGEADLHIGGAGTTLFQLGSRVAGELSFGMPHLVMIRGETGFAVLSRASEDTVLLTLTVAQAALGLVFLDVKRCGEAIALLRS